MISIRFIGGLAVVLGLTGLSACGPEADQAEPAAESGLEGFEPNAATPEADEDTAPPEETAFAQSLPSEDATGNMSRNPENTGEDMYRRGLYPEALAQWETDAEAGDAYAAYRLGVEYFDAHHVERDIPLSARYQQLASDLGSPAAMFELGSFYEAGLGVPYDLNMAGEWYFESARRGYPPAQHNVATMFEDGVGRPRDLIQAYLYYTLAVDQGFQVNFEQLLPGEGSVFVDPSERLEEMMSQEEVAEAQALIAGFEPQD